jgi:hypothetical protein
MTKYLGPKSDPANVASQSDVDGKPSLSSTNPTTIQPDASAAVGTGTTAARADHTHAIVAAAAGTITGTNAEGTSTSFARADHNHAFGSKSVPASALALGPTYETSLPGSPVDGQEIYYAANATNSIIWHLRYRSAARSGSGAWEFVGGTPLFGGPQGDITTTSTTHTALTSGPAITVPRRGIYRVTVECAVTYARVGADQSFTGQSYSLGVSVGGASPNTFITGSFIDNFEFDNGSRTRELTYATSDALTIRVRNDQASEEVRYYDATLSIVPVYIY